MNKRIVRLPLTFLFLIIALLAIFPPDSISFRWWSNHAEWVAVAFLLIGMAFLMINQRRMMFVALGCSAMICLYLNETTESKLSYSKPKDLPFIRVAHFNVTNSEGHVEAFMEAMLSQNADIISIQEITYEWDSVLNTVLTPHYPHRICMPRFDPFGIALFSRLPYEVQDTFFHGDIANLSVEVLPSKTEEPIRIIASIIEPPLSSKSFSKMRSHLEKISFEVNQKELPTICLGEYNTTGWSEEIQEFKIASDLSGSRMGMKIPQPNGRFPLLSVPLDHIFYSSDFECIHFAPIQNAFSDYIGINGSYQIKNEDDGSKKAD